jgi:hypothetical protein
MKSEALRWLQHGRLGLHGLALDGFYSVPPASSARAPVPSRASPHPAPAARAVDEEGKRVDLAASGGSDGSDGSDDEYAQQQARRPARRRNEDACLEDVDDSEAMLDEQASHVELDTARRRLRSHARRR